MQYTRKKVAVHEAWSLECCRFAKRPVDFGPEMCGRRGRVWTFAQTEDGVLGNRVKIASAHVTVMLNQLCTVRYKRALVRWCISPSLSAVVGKVKKINWVTYRQLSFSGEQLIASHLQVRVAPMI